MVRIDQAGHHQEIIPTQYRGVRVLLAKFLKGPDLLDHSIVLINRPLLQDASLVPRGTGNEISSVDYG